jgi:GR25 family glycosyltransferase involved in LPS biosynthesis
MNIPIFCINLERATERKSLIQKEWMDKLNLDITFWKGYDRKNITNNKFIYPYDKKLAINFMDRPLSEGEIACATSFCLLYEHLLENNYEEVIIMEDDITPLIKNKDKLFNTISEGKKEFPTADMMLLHEYPDANKEKVYSVKKEIFSMCDESPWGNQLFYTKKLAILELYLLLRTMSMPADHPQRELSSQQRVIIVNKALCHHEWTGPKSTTYIGNEYRNSHRKFIDN